MLGRVDIGSSLQDENAQTLASQNSKEILPCYLQPEADDSLWIPVIDMSKLLDQQDPISRPDELARLYSACKDRGFFQVTQKNL